MRLLEKESFTVADIDTLTSICAELEESPTEFTPKVLRSLIAKLMALDTNSTGGVMSLL